MWSAIGRRGQAWILTLCVWLLPVAGHAADIVLSIADTTIPAGGSADVVVSLANAGARPVLGIDFSLLFNPAVVSFTSVTVACSGVTCGWTLDTHTLADRVTFVAYGSSAVTTGGAIAHFLFSNPGASPVALCASGITILSPRVGGPPGDYSVCVTTPCGPNPCGPVFALALAPAADSKLVGQTYTATATLTQDGAPKSGATVDFQVTSGPHAGPIQHLTTNGSGVATFSYTGTAAGTDVITANAPVQTGIPATVLSVPSSVTCAWTSVWTLTLAQPTSPVCAGAQVTATATLKENNVPKSGLMVDFQITSGPNAGVPHSFATNGSGVASFAYTTGPTGGTDVIVANVAAQPGVPSPVPSTPSSVSVVIKSFSLGAAPPSATHDVGQPHTVTATLLENGSPRSGAGIEFHIASGPHMRAAETKSTNGSGIATYTYTGTAGGTDQITVRAVAQTGIPCEVSGGTVSATWNSTCLLVLAETVSSRTLVEIHEVTAKLTLNGAPLSNKTVNFQITSGPNAGAVLPRTTDTSGVAKLTYPGTVVGTDVITAVAPIQSGLTVAVTSTPASVNCLWSGPPPCVLSVAAPGTLPVGATCLMTATITQGGVPLPGRSVGFEVISGPHRAVPVAHTTNSAGKAIHSSTSSVDGIDRVTISSAGCTPPSITVQCVWEYRTKIELTPIAAANLPGQPHVLTGTVRLGPAVQPNVNVRCEIISGPNLGKVFASQNSDAQGRVTFSYTSAVEGIDLIRCLAPVQAGVPIQSVSNTAVKNWGAVPPFNLIGVDAVDLDAGADDFLKFPDVSTGVGVRIGNFGSPFAEVEAIAVQPSSNVIFAADDDRLLSVDPATGAGTLIGTIGFPDVDGIAFDPLTSILYGVTHTANKLIKIDPVTGAGTLVKAGFLVSYRLHDIAFRPNGECYVLTDRPAVFRIDPSTGATLGRWNFPNNRNMEALAWSPDGSTLYTAYERDLLNKDLAVLHLIGLDTSTSTFVHPALHSGFRDIEALTFVPSSVVRLLVWPMPLVPVDAPPAATAWELSQNYPNPFNPTTRVVVVSPEAGRATLAVFDPSGRLVRTLYRGPITAGAHHFAWDGLDRAGIRVGSGIYFCRLEAPGVEKNIRMVLAK